MKWRRSSRPLVSAPKVDERSERMNAKIRDAQKQKIPYMLVVGDQEEESGQVALAPAI